MRTAHLTGGGPGAGRDVEIPLPELPERIDFVTGSGTVPYQRVGTTAEYRPANLLDRTRG